MEYGTTLWATVLVLLLTSGLLFPTIIKLHRRSPANRPDGLYVISEPENGSQASFEIVAVHGLGAHPEYTWTAQTPSRSSNSEERTRVHLLRDFLKHDFPKARIIAFAHNSDWLIDAPVTTAQLIGERLLDGLVNHRRKHRCIPIVFIGHSFGGIIIKEALCKPGKDAKEIVDSTSGIVFLGTPHQGSPMSLFGVLAARIASVFGSSIGLLLSLSSHRDKLSDLDERFYGCMKIKEDCRQRTEIVAFRETKPTRIFGWLSIGLVVFRDSARGAHGATMIDIDTDHSGLNKCTTREDTLYMNLKRELNRLGATTAPTLNGNQKFVVGNLRTRIVEDAAFDSRANEQIATCIKDTRHELLKEMMYWSSNQTGEHVYWLQGKAGTGKSTIARTIAAHLSANGCLAGSFFFRRTESDRSNAGRLFTTIAVQLVERLPSVAEYVRNVIEADPNISAKGLGEQFRKLIQRPLEAACHTLSKPMTVVIDALDECETDQDITTIIRLIVQNDPPQAGPLKFLITSRYEPPIRLGFNDSHGKFVEFPLHTIPAPTVERDIATYLEFRIGEIRRQHKIAENWPSQAMLQNLIKKSIPLFIFAATACRFIEDNRQGGGGPDSRLQQILQHEAYGDLDQTYVPALNQMVQGLKDTPRRNAIAEFKKIVGAIVTLSSPLGATSLANLLGIAVECVDNRLQLLHSVLDIPTDSTAPVRIFHESFREYLVYSDEEDKHQFWVDERATHNMLAERCLRLLSENSRLKQDICGLAEPGRTRFSIEKHEIDQCLPPEVQYATLYWVHHLKGSGAKLCDGHQVLRFLQCHFLHWLEALSLIGRTSEGIRLIGELQSLTELHGSTEISLFLQDANRFILEYRSIIDQAPLQLYASALIFAPETSVIRNLFHHYASLVSAKAIVEQNWSACLQTLEGHSGWVESVAVSGDGRHIASASRDEMVKIWDAATGTLQSTLQGHSGWVNSIDFSGDGRHIASASRDETVKIWDVATGRLQSTLEGHSGSIHSVVFSGDGRCVASASRDETVKIWDAATGTLQSTLEGHSGSVYSVVFSSDGRRVASASDDKTVKIWDVATGTLQSTLQGHSDWVRSVVFSGDGRRIASASFDKTVKIWDVATGTLQSMLEGHSGYVYSVAFSSDGRRIASSSDDKTVKIWDAATDMLQSTLEGHSGSIYSVVFSSDGRRVASASRDKTVKIWDVATGTLQSTLQGHSDLVKSVVFSGDGRHIVSASDDKTVKIWNAATGTLQSTLQGHSDCVSSVVFSGDGRHIASASCDDTVKIWNAATGTLQSTLKGHSGLVLSVTFSGNGKRVASASRDKTVKIWDATTGTLQSTLEGNSGLVLSVTFSGNGNRVASTSIDKTVKIWNAATGTLQSTFEGQTVKIWDAATGTLQSTLKGHSRHVYSVAFSSDGKRIASASFDKTVKIWDVATGTLQSMLEGHSGYVYSVAFSSDGRRIASSSDDKTVKIWDAATGMLQSTLEGHSGSIYSVVFSGDGRCVASASHDETVKIWDAATGTLQSTLAGYSEPVTLNNLMHDYTNVAESLDHTGWK
ncbi:hypothetical protein ARSEF4850_008817 [Beauveria asiatica]